MKLDNRTDVLKLLSSKASIKILKSVSKPPKLGEKAGMTKSDISTETDVVYSHTVDKIKNLEKWGLVRVTQNGRSSNVQATNEGKEVAKKIDEISELLQPIDRR